MRFRLLAPAPWWSQAKCVQDLWGSGDTTKPSCHICYWWPHPKKTRSPEQEKQQMFKHYQLDNTVFISALANRQSSIHMMSDLLRAQPVWPAWCRPHSQIWPKEPSDQTPPEENSYTWTISTLGSWCTAHVHRLGAALKVFGLLTPMYEQWELTVANFTMYVFIVLMITFLSWNRNEFYWKHLWTQNVWNLSKK